ncbi:MAG: hypothetical protein LBR74_04730 [Eubacterium sp.]|jgi:hypothetical protein|nr:hypothetical protein [Eubacterium sp.]
MRVFQFFGRYFIFANRREVRDMAVIYVTLIVKGKYSFANVPEILKGKVSEMLNDLDLGELAQ